ncbi:MAG: DMT family transporter [Pseudomonadota bacterium]
MSVSDQDRTSSAAIESRANLGVIYVWIAILIFASANSVVLLLINKGAELSAGGVNPINFCNVLFAGNLCAFIAMSIIYRKQWTRENLVKLDWKDWTSLVLLATITGALVPALMFLALMNSSVTSAVLVGRIEPFILIFLSSMIFSERFQIWPTIGAVVAFLGVLITFYLRSDGGFDFGRGELQAAAAAILTAVSTIVAKARLKNIPLGIFTVARTGLGTVIFFVTTIYLLGWEHFADLGSPILWQWMVFYGAIIVVGGQYFWFSGIKTTRTTDVSLASSFTPIAGVAFAFALLGERPDTAVIIGGVVIVFGIILGQVGNILAARAAEAKTARDEAEAQAAAQAEAQASAPAGELSGARVIEREREVNFKGV